MKGQNTLSLCPATMEEIVQQWADKEFSSKLRVTSVKQDGTGKNPYSFSVTVEAVEDGVKSKGGE